MQAYKLEPRALLQNSIRLHAAYEKLSAELYRVRSKLSPRDPFRRYFEDRFSDLSLEMLAIEGGSAKIRGSYTYGDFWRDYRKIWRNHFSLFLLILFIFMSATMLGWFFGTEDPSYAALILGPQQMEMIILHQKWFESLQDSPFMGGLSIAINNVSVAIKACLGAALAGIGGLYILIYNGVMVGAVMGFSVRHEFDAALGEFVIAHGILELSVIVAACFVGLLFGRAFYVWPVSRIPSQLAEGGKEALVALMGCLPWLLLAAIVEAFVSPFYFLDAFQKFLVGAAVALFFWAWTFWPLPQPSR